MKSRNAATLGLILAAALTLSACSSGAGDSSAPAAQDPYATSTAEPTAMEPTTASDSFVTDSSGMTVYMYDSDTQGSGTSTCTGGCLSAWPPVPGDATLIGATGEVTTITGTDGNPQLALNGWPLYYYASDSVAGDETGQGVGGVWWVLDASGEPVRN